MKLSTWTATLADCNEFVMHVCRSSATRLTGLLLAGNQFLGTLPNSWAKMQSLIYLDLQGNQLTGSLPASWKPKALVYLQLANNQFTGPLPAWPAPNLLVFDVGMYVDTACMGNRLSGQIPSTLAKMMPRLNRLNLQCNRLIGTLPHELGAFAELTTLDVSSNPALTGSLPRSLSNLTKLEYLSVSNTRTSGSIPDSFGSMVALNVLDVARTNLSGCVPAGLQRLARLLHEWKATTGITHICS